MDWLDGLFETAGEFATSAIEGIDWETVAKDALAGAVIAEISGGDTWKSAMFSGFGSMVGSSDYGKQLFNGYAPEVGGAISGYGIAESSGESGLLGALAGAGYKSMTTGQMSKDQDGLELPSGSTSGDTSGDTSGPSSSTSTDIPSSSTVPEVAGGDWLEKYGLIDSDGKPTTMGESAAKAILVYHQMNEAKKTRKEGYKKSQFESNQSIAQEQAVYDMKFKEKQRQIGGLARYGSK